MTGQTKQYRLHTSVMDSHLNHTTLKAIRCPLKPKTISLNSWFYLYHDCNLPRHESNPSSPPAHNWPLFIETLKRLYILSQFFFETPFNVTCIFRLALLAEIKKSLKCWTKKMMELIFWEWLTICHWRCIAPTGHIHWDFVITFVFETVFNRQTNRFDPICCCNTAI